MRFLAFSTVFFCSLILGMIVGEWGLYTKDQMDAAKVESYQKGCCDSLESKGLRRVLLDGKIYYYLEFQHASY